MKPDPVLENVRLAVACGADPALALAVALASSKAQTAAEAFAVLDERRSAIEEILSQRGDLKVPAKLEPELTFEPELGRLRRDLADHEIRDKLLFRDLLGKHSYFQVAVYAIDGVMISASDAELIGQVAIVTTLMDPTIWPLTVARRVSRYGGGLARALVAGVASVCTPNMAALPVAGFMRFLDRLDAEMRTGKTLEVAVDEMLERRERIFGVGRPAFGPDERVPPMLALHERFGRADGHSVKLTARLDAYLHERKGLRVNSAGHHGSLLRDMGLSPRGAAALSMLYFMVPILANVTFPEERTSAD